MSSDIDPAKLKVVDLRNELAIRGLDQKGVKAVLVKRLKDYLDKESESKESQSEILVTKTEETPRKSARKSADERDEVKPTKSVVVSPTTEKAQPQENVDKPPQGKPIPPKEVIMQELQGTTESNSGNKSVVTKLPETHLKDVKSLGQLKTIDEPSDTPDKGKVEVKSSENPNSEVQPLESATATENIKTKVQSPEKPKSEVKSLDEVKSEENITEEPKIEDESQEKSEEGETPESTKLDHISEGDASPKKPMLDGGNEEQEKETLMEVQGDSEECSKKEARTGYRGEKRKRSGDSPDRSPKRYKAPPEDEPEINFDNVQLSWYDSDLHLLINKSSFLSAKPINDGAFGYAWAGARGTHGVSSGKVYYEVKLTEKLKWEDFSNPSERHRFDSRSRRDDRRHGRRYENKDGRKSDADKLKDRSDRTEKKQDNESVKKEASMEVVENNTGNEKLATDNNETNSETNENKSEEKMETDIDQNLEKEDANEEVKKEEKTDKENDEAKKDVEKDKNSEEQGNIEKEMDTEEKDGNEKEMDTEEKDGNEKEMETEEKDGNEKEKEAEEKEGDEKEKDEEDKKKESENIDKEKPEDPPLPTHYIRIGWSVINSSLQLGEDSNSFAFESSGNFVKNKEFVAYGVPFDIETVIGSYLDFSEETVTLRFSINGELQPPIEIPKSELPENVTLYPHVLSRNYEFEVNFGEKDEPWFAISSEVDGYNFISKVENKVEGPKRPENRSDCEVLLMCGLPASGKTHWVNEHVAANADKNYTVLGNNSILDKMTVCGEPLKSKYKGKWGILIDRVQKCLNKLVSTAALRRRNYIIDQTNVFASAQSRKMRPFEGFKRKAVIVVVGDEEQARRQALKEVPDSTILGMKAAMVLPVVGDWFEEVLYVGVEEKEANEIIKKYNEDGRAAGFPADKRRDNRRNDHGRHFQRRSGYQQSYQSSRRWDRPQRRDGDGSRWKHDSRSRDWRGSNYDRSRDYYGQGSYDRRRSQYGGRSSGDWDNGGGSSWGNRNQNSGWNQQGYGRNYNQPWNNGGNQNWGKYNSGSGGWQGYSGNWNNYGQQGNWNQAQQYHQPPPQTQQQTAYSTNSTVAQNQQYSQPYNAQEAWAQYARQYAQHQQMAQAAAAESQKR